MTSPPSTSSHPTLVPPTSPRSTRSCSTLPTAPTLDATDAPDVPVARDVPVVAFFDPCAPSAIVDLATAGTRTANVVRYTGSNAAVPDVAGVGSTCGPTVAPVFHRYVPSADVRVTISTRNPGTAATFNTVLVVTDACGAPTYGGTRALGCNDNVGLGSFTSQVVVADARAGTPVYIAVAGYSHTSSGARGTYALSITEVPLVTAGATCDRTLTASACAAGFACSSVDPPVCVADGTLGGACRATYPACGAGLGCNASGRCVTASMGVTCSPLLTVCPSDTGCETPFLGGSIRCAPFGIEGERCYPQGTSTRCAAGLICNSGGRCRPPVAAGGACEFDSHCAGGETCGGGVCIAAGARDGRCRTDRSTSPCDAGSTCSTTMVDGLGGICVAITPVGGACRSITCAAGSSCVGTTPSAFGSCVVDGTVSGARCRRGSTTGTCADGTNCQSVEGVALCRPAPYVESTAPAGEYVEACAVGRTETFDFAEVNSNRTARPLPLSFVFRYFGTAQTLLWPGVGAIAAFDTSYPPTGRVNFAEPDGYPALVPFQLVTNRDDSVWLRASGSRICSATVGAAPNRRFAVEWNDFTIGRELPAAHLTFEVVLHETSNVIDFLYRRLEPATGTGSEYTDGLLADVGLVARIASTAAPVLHRGPVSTAAGIRFTPR